MREIKWIVREVFRGKQNLEERMAPLILPRLSLTAGAESDIMELTEQPQDSLCSGKGEKNGTSDE